MLYNAELLRAKKAILKKSNEQIGEQAGCSHVLVSQIMNGKAKNPGLEKFARVCEAVGLTLEEVTAIPIPPVVGPGVVALV